MSMSEIAPRSTRAGLQERAEHCHSAFQSRSLASSPWRPRSEVSPRCGLRRRLEKIFQGWETSGLCTWKQLDAMAALPNGYTAFSSNRMQLKEGTVQMVEHFNRNAKARIIAEFSDRSFFGATESLSV